MSLFDIFGRLAAALNANTKAVRDNTAALASQTQALNALTSVEQQIEDALTPQPAGFSAVLTVNKK